MIRLLPVSLLLLSAIVVLSCAPQSKELSGVVVYGHEARTVQLCGDHELFWLHTTPELHVLLDAEVQRLTQRPYQEVYLDFAGSMMSDSPGEFAKDFEGTIKLEKIHKLSAVVPNRCRRF